MSFFDGEDEAVGGELDGGRHVLGEGEFAVVLLRVGEASDGAGDTAGLIADEGHVWNDIALGVEVHVAAGGCGGFFAVVEEVCFAVLVADEHKATAADIAREGVNDRESKADGHGCVDGVASLLEDLDAGVGGVVMDGDDYGVLGADGLFGRLRAGWTEE